MRTNKQALHCTVPHHIALNFMYWIEFGRKKYCQWILKAHTVNVKCKGILRICYAFLAIIKSENRSWAYELICITVLVFMTLTVPVHVNPSLSLFVEPNPLSMLRRRKKNAQRGLKLYCFDWTAVFFLFIY